MASESTASSYKRYKAVTDAVATWLLTTAKKHGCRAYDSVDCSPVASAAPRLKGKSRKLAREAEAAAGQQPNSSIQAYRIKVKDFIQLAQYIAESTKPRIKVPDYAVQDLQQAIAARKEHQALYAKFPGESDSAAADQGHAHFIQTLEVVMETLRPNMSEASRSRPARDNVEAEGAPLTNIFEHLTVEEPSEADDSSAGVRREAAAEKIKVTVSDAEENEKEEAFIASLYIARDTHRLLENVREVWTSYKQGRIDLTAAAITTNTAIEFCRKLQEEFEATFPTQKALHEHHCSYCLYLQDAGDEHYNSNCLSGTCLATARDILRAFTNPFLEVETRVPSAAMPLYMGGGDRSAMDESQKFEQDVGLAIGLIPEFFALIDALPEVQGEHELFRGLGQLKKDKKQTFTLTFAFQAYLEIRHILRESVDQGFQDLRREGQLLKKSINRVLDLHREMGSQGPDDNFLQSLSYTIEDWVEHDQMDTIFARRRPLLYRSHLKELPPYYHFERDPLWCGLLLYKFRMWSHDCAIRSANSWTCIMATAHLYNSLRQTGVLRCEWPDMENLIMLHGAKNLFVGDLPTTFIGFVKNFSLSMGLPASMLARNARRRTSPLPCFKPRKFLGMLAPTMWKFKSGICEGDSRGVLGPGDVKEFMRKTVSEETGSRYFDAATDASSILQLLPLEINLETPEVTFDHFELHIVCWKLLRELHSTFDNSVPGWSEMYPNNKALSVNMLYLWGDLSHTDRVMAAEAVGEQLPSARIFEEAGKMVERLIAREGDVASKRMRGMDKFASST